MNRARFLFTKTKLNKCGNKVLFEAPFETEGLNCITIGDNFRSKPGFHLAAIKRHNGIEFSPNITIGKNVSINYDVHIACINHISIGDGTLIASKVFITDHFHGDTCKESLDITPGKRQLFSKGPVVIDNDVWIGEGAAILPGVHIGNNSVIGANSVVTHDVAPYSVVAGSPAREIKQYKI